MKASTKKTVLIAVVGAVVTVGVMANMRPDQFSVTRTATIDAPASKVFPHVNNLHNWQAWSPWAKMDPNAAVTYAGPDAGKDASMSWDGNNDIGKGTMTIVDSKANEKVDFRLDFEKPMKGTNESTFALAEADKQTTVTWSMTGHQNFVAKVVGLFMNCEKMVGEQFDAGLTNLKGVVEAEPVAVKGKKGKSQ